MTQRELALRARLTVNYLSLLENGHRGIGLGQLQVIADVLEIPASFVVTLAETPTDRGDARLLRSIQSLIRETINAGADAATVTAE